MGEAWDDVRRVARCFHPVGRLRPDVAEPALPAARSIDLPGRGTVVARIVEGRAPVLLLHGWALTADVNFVHLMNPLAGTHGLISMDHRGHGRGVAPRDRFSLEACVQDIVALLDALGTDRVIVCGYSLGGPIGLELAERYPGRVAGLVLEATALCFDSPVDRLAKPFLHAIRPLTRFDRGRTMPLRYFGDTRARSAETARLWPWLRRELVRCHPQVIVDVMLAEYAFDFRPRTAAVAGIPTAVVVTTRDRAVPPADQRDMARRLKAPVIEIDDDHDVFLADPDRYVAATLDAIRLVEG
jgi:pimeloyl-ACP methyl ester carboxylesterase